MILYMMLLITSTILRRLLVRAGLAVTGAAGTSSAIAIEVLTGQVSSAVCSILYTFMFSM